MDNNRLISLSRSVKVLMNSLDKEELCSAYEDLLYYKESNDLRDGVFKFISQRISEVSGVTDFGLDYTSNIILLEMSRRYYDDNK